MKSHDFGSFERARFSRILESYRTAIIRFVYRFLNNPAAAEEVAQEVFMQAHRSLPSSVPSTRYVIWLFQSALQLAQRTGDIGAAPQEPGCSPRIMLLRLAISRLPASQRAAVLMHKYEGLNCNQIANVLGCSDSAVQFMLVQAYQKLRAQIPYASTVNSQNEMADLPRTG